MNRIPILIYLILTGVFFYIKSQHCDVFITSDSVVVVGNEVRRTSVYQTPEVDGQIRVSVFERKKKIYMKILTCRILYFDTQHDLEVISDEMSIIFKNVKQIKSDKQKGYFLVEITPNYVTTLKNFGITEIRFNKMSEKVSKKVVKSVREMAECFLTQIKSNKP